MFGSRKVVLSPELYAAVQRTAALAGYASVDEFVRHVLEQEVARHVREEQPGDAEIDRRLRGLGYLC